VRTETSVVERFSDASVLVIGDTMVDEYMWGQVRRISPEAPVPVLEFSSRTYVAGGAANAAANVASLGGRAELGGVVGTDIEADMLRKDLTRKGVHAHLVGTPDRPTTTKTRVLAGSQQILRIDRETRDPITSEVESSLLDWAGRTVSSVDCILVSDYDKGVVTSALSRALIDLARAVKKPIVVDPKGRDYSKYVGATVITPNVSEVHLAAEPLGFTVGDLEADVRSLQSLLRGTSFLVTMGPEGVTLFDPGGQARHISAEARSVFDVTGAGDTLVAGLALAMASRATLLEAAIVANAVAGVVVGKVGTSTVSLSELERPIGGARAGTSID
jgi:rfaE bifunctional protein kinase chain/domain